MSNNYIIDTKAVSFETRSNDFTLQPSDFLKWIKVDTNTQDITVTLPNTVPIAFFLSGWNCTIENIGTGIINIVTAVGVSLDAPATSINDQYRSAQFIHEGSGLWRGQGYLGPNDLTSLEGVTTTAPFPSDYNALAYDGTTNQWIPRPFPRYLQTDTLIAGHSLADSDHRKLYLVDTSVGTITITQNPGLQAGLSVEFINIGIGTINFTGAGNIESQGGASATSLTGMWATGRVYHQSLENYYLLGDWTT